MVFKIHGKVVEKETGKGVPNLIVKAIDKDLLFDDLLGAVITDMDGNFEIRYDKEDFQELFFDKKPDIYLKINAPDGKVICTTEDKVRYGAGETERFIVKIPRDSFEFGPGCIVDPAPPWQIFDPVPPFPPWVDPAPPWPPSFFVDPVPQIPDLPDLLDEAELAQIEIKLIDMKITQAQAHITMLESQKEMLSKKFNLSQSNIK